MSAPLRQRGFGLVELMVGLALGLLIVAGALGIFLSTRQVSRTADNLSRLQEGARFAFELMSRELREAGNTPCGSGWLNIKSLVTATDWWAPWQPIRGYDSKTAFAGAAFGTAAGARVSETSALELRSAQGSTETLVTGQTSGSELQLGSSTELKKPGDIGLVCDYKKGLVFRTASISGLAINTGDLGLNLLQAKALLVRLNASAWYIGQTGRAETGGRALYRVTPAGAQEVIDGVQDMKVAYLSGDTYQDATAIANWGDVTAARITLTLQGPQRNAATNKSAGDDDARITRTFTHTVALRNNMP